MNSYTPKEENIIRSKKEFNEKYFPRAAEKERISNMSPEEFGNYLAEKDLEKLREHFN